MRSSLARDGGESLAYDAAMLGAEADNAVRGIVTIDDALADFVRAILATARF